MKVEEKKAILSILMKYVGIEEDAPVQLKDFLLLPEYKKLQDEQCFLILGERGTGKTCLFNMFSSEEGYQLIMEDNDPFSKWSETKGSSLKGYDRSGLFATPDILGTALFSDDRAITAYWAGSLIIVLSDKLKTTPGFLDGLQSQMSTTMFQMLSNPDYLLEPSKWVPMLKDSPEEWEKVLRWIDQFLDQNHQILYVAYDHLDRVSNEYNRLFPLIRTLLSFWFTRVARWRRIRCKIFLRYDLYKNPEMLRFPDASKIKKHQMILSWKPFMLYQLLVKRLANHPSPHVLPYLNLTPGLVSDKGTSAGYQPTDNKNVMKQFIKNLIGEYMGKTPKKGASYSWIPNHLQDANGALAPRPFINCFREAAAYMLDNPEAMNDLEGTQLLLPTSIQKALIRVSEDRVSELTEEYVWLAKLRDLVSGLTMLMDKEDFISHINMDAWDDSEKATLPEQSAYGLFSVLENLGIVIVTSDNRVNVPEIYLHGFHMKRRGGLKRPKEE